MDATTHWENVYRTRQPHEVSWFQREAVVSLGFIRRLAPDRTRRIIDVGGGASTLVDSLVEAGYREITVLDVSPTALQLAARRLGALASFVTWHEADILAATFPLDTFDVWHDRAVFHFLTSTADRARYVSQARRAIAPGGFALVSTFAEDGPASCSGLPVSRYSAASLHQEFGAPFRLVESAREEHVTPSGARQAFVYCLFTKDSLDDGLGGLMPERTGT